MGTPTSQVSVPAVAACAATATVALGSAQGGYFPTTWGWASLVAVVVAAVALAAGAAFASSQGRATLGLLGLFALWTAVEVVRPHQATAGVPQLERDALYLAALVAALLVLSVAPATAVAAGVAVGGLVLCADGLGEYLVGSGTPDLVEGRLLYQPLGYANAIGAIAAMSFALTLGFVSARDLATRRLAAATLVLPVSTLGFSGSRGAALALGIGLAALLALSVDRRLLLRTILVSVPAGLMPVYVAHHGGLTHSAGSRLLIVLLVVLAGAATTFLVLAPGRAASVAAGVCVAAAAAAAALGTVRHGSTFAALGFRRQYWQVAWQDALRHPFGGSGPGTFERVWLRDRPIQAQSRNAHSLYLETLAELGSVGLVLLVAALAVPLVALRRAREPVRLAAGCAYLVFVLHAGVDWDWQMPAVTVTALVCAAVVLPNRPLGRRKSSRRYGGVACCVAAFVLFALSLAGNRALSQARAAADDGGPPGRAMRTAERAVTLQPWSADALVVLGRLRARAGRSVAAAESFRGAARLDPTNLGAWFGLVQTTTGRARQAALRRVAALDPLDAP